MKNSFPDFVVRERLKDVRAYLFDTGSIVLSHSILLNASSCVIISFMLRVSAVARIVASRPPIPRCEYFARRSKALNDSS